ncbi:MAG: helix-turn-helix domain-containing protein [Solirubrobacterales bacterium]
MSNESSSGTPRQYRKRLRADNEQQTRERITRAAVKLHGSIGPARTTVSGVAAEAGVQRATVYRHFPDEEALFVACSAHYWARHPFPDIAAWSAIGDPAQRLRRGLREFYAFYEETEAMLEATSRDAALVPAMAATRDAFVGFLDAARGVLLSGRPERRAARRRTEAAIGHALLFPTWQSLVRLQGLRNSEAVAVMAGMVEAAGAVKVEQT